MNKLKGICAITLTVLLVGCSTQKYVVQEVGYSSWTKEQMIIRKKTILLNTETGETWGLTYKRQNPTKDGYAWEKLPKEVVAH